MTTIELSSIGIIHTPFYSQAGTPVQPAFGGDTEGRVVVDRPYVSGLADLDGFERIWLLFHLHRSAAWKPRVVPYRDVQERGLFATRAPARPSPIGLSVVRLVSVEEDTLLVRGVDMLDGTPLLDIKPYVPEFDAWPGSRAGWLDNCSRDRRTADGRFSPTESE